MFGRSLITPHTIKQISLVFLTLQAAFSVIISRYSRTLSQGTYISSVLVCSTEITKLVLSFFIFSYQCKSLKIGLIISWKEIVLNFYGTLKVSLPSFIYVIQNNLLYYAISNLNAPTFQVCYQIKILTTALFGAILLGKRLSVKQIISLFILFTGISIVSVDLGLDKKQKTLENPLGGIIALVASSITSGFAGIYSEKCLKQAKSSLWLVNIQMASIGTILSFIVCLIQDHDEIFSNGPFYNFNQITIVVLCTQALGGLLTSIVIKYSDNILKTFAASFSIILSTIISVLFFHTILKSSFIIGTVLVILSSIMYSYN